MQVLHGHKFSLRVCKKKQTNIIYIWFDLRTSTDQMDSQQTLKFILFLYECSSGSEAITFKVFNIGKYIA